MNTKRSVLSAGLTFAFAFAFSCLADNQVQIQKLTHQPLVEIQTAFNYLLDYHADNTAIITNLVDGLLENDNYGNLVPSLAEDWSVSSGGLTYTYKLRKVPNGSRLTVKSTPQLRHKILWQVSSTQWIINHRPLTWFKTRLRAWLIILQERILTFLRLGWRPLTTRLLSILCHGQNLTGTQNNQQYSFSQ